MVASEGGLGIVEYVDTDVGIVAEARGESDVPESGEVGSCKGRFGRGDVGVRGGSDLRERRCRVGEPFVERLKSMGLLNFFWWSMNF